MRLITIGLLFTVTACLADQRPTDPWPADPAAQILPDRMQVEPERAASGAIVEVRFPQGWDRGLLYAIDERSGDQWERLFMLTSDANGGQPTWFAPEDEGFGVEAIGIAGNGPDRVPIPDPLEPGQYRICTANAAEDICAAITVDG